MDYINTDIHKKEKYIVSVSKIIRIFENVKEIHFVKPSFTNLKTLRIVLDNFVQYLIEHPNTQLIQLKFLYYNDCDENTFSDFVKGEIVGKLRNEKWDIEMLSHGGAYQIRVFTVVIDYETNERQDYQMGDQEIDKIIRANWKSGSLCQIYSNSRQSWFEGMIISVVEDSQEEWLKVTYGDEFRGKTQIQRFHKHIIPHIEDLKQKDKIKRTKGEKRRTSVVKEKQKYIEAKYAPSSKSSLHLLSSAHICANIKHWIYNDIDYKKYLLKTKNLFSKHKINGSQLKNLSSKHIEHILKTEMLKYMTADTFKIIFEMFEMDKQEEPHKFIGLSSDQVTEILYNYPINNLLLWITNDEIDGQQFLNNRKLTKMIKAKTGWTENEIYQIESIIIQESSCKKSQIMRKLTNGLKNYPSIFSQKIINMIRDRILEFDVEEIYYKIKNGMPIAAFSNMICTLVNELIQNTAKQDIAAKFYDIMAECFVVNCQPGSHRQRWVCNNCGDNNFNSYINNKENTDLSACWTCGVTQKVSIVFKIKNIETFTMVNENKKSRGNTDQEQHSTINSNDIDQLIKSIINSHKFQLCCPNRTDHEPCPAILRLVKQLIYFNKWNSQPLKMDPDVYNIVSDDTFNTILIESAKKINKVEIELVKNMIANNIIDKHTFLALSKKSFLELLRKEAKIGINDGRKLLKEIRLAILLEFDMESIVTDYHHILNAHINYGDKSSTTNTFNFFKLAVHYNDSVEIHECKSETRRKKRMKQRNSNDDNKYDPVHEESMHDLKALNHEYIRNMLDIIHYGLVHSKSQEFISKYSNYPETHPNSKYVIDVSQFQSNGKINNNEYGFGFEHSHTELSPKWNSIPDELLYNTLYTFTVLQFQTLLIKAVRLHKILQKSLRCKYFDRRHNIIRNDPISVRHVLALVVYADMTQFCTVFRETCRATAQEHVEFYYFARSLHEAVEFFGEPMGIDLKVYHALNHKMLFSKFTAHFQQPLSTSKKRRTADNYAQHDGLILVLKAAASSNSQKTPKYLSLSEISDFPDEKELLFYGSYMQFSIYDIIEANGKKSHSMELWMLRTFQSIMQNEIVNLKKDDKQNTDMIDALVSLIHSQQNKCGINCDEEKTEYAIKPKNSNITEYGEELFISFCKTARIWINCTNFMLLPDKLYQVLFVDSTTGQLSLVPIVRLFPNLRELTFGDLSLQEMKTPYKYGDGYKYMQIVLEFVKNLSFQIHSNVEKIQFKSKQKQIYKENSTLASAVNKYSDEFVQHQWVTKYACSHADNSHNITFINKQTSKTFVKSNPRNISNSSLLYFMQVTCVDEAYFTIVVQLSKPFNEKKVIYIKEINTGNRGHIIVFKKHVTITKINIPIHEDHNALYHLALFANKTADYPFDKSIANQLRFEVLINEQEHPELNGKYKPQCIDLNKVLKLGDNIHQKLNIYWSVPPKCYGEISYIAINDNTKQKTIVHILPYCVPLSSMPTSFKVITVVKDERGAVEEMYKSNPSESITCKV